MKPHQIIVSIYTYKRKTTLCSKSSIIFEEYFKYNIRDAPLPTTHVGPSASVIQNHTHADKKNVFLIQLNKIIN